MGSRAFGAPRQKVTEPFEGCPVVTAPYRQPLGAAAGSYLEMRKMFETGYRDVIAVAFGGGRSLSADTGMGEMMLLARKGTSGRAGVGYVHIDEPLYSASAGAEIARVITETLADADVGDWGR